MCILHLCFYNRVLHTSHRYSKLSIKVRSDDHEYEFFIIIDDDSRIYLPHDSRSISRVCSKNLLYCLNVWQYAKNSIQIVMANE